MKSISSGREWLGRRCRGHAGDRARPWPLRKELEDPRHQGLARVKALQGDLAGAIELYRALNEPDAADKWTAMLEPRYVLELARLLDETGEKDAAREEYERFLELWKDADPGRPELAEARAYVAR